MSRARAGPVYGAWTHFGPLRKIQQIFPFPVEKGPPLLITTWLFEDRRFLFVPGFLTQGTAVLAVLSS